jgi:hypothetical protein
VSALALALALTAAAVPGWRTDHPDVTEIDLPRFHIFATREATSTAQMLAKRLESDRDAIATHFGGDYPGLTEVRVGEGVDELVRLDVPDSATPRWAAGITHPGGNVILFDAAALRREGGLRLIRHELAHAALGQLGGPDLPRWFQEGLAVTAANEWSTESDLAMVRAAQDHLPLESLDRGFPDGMTDLGVAYAESASFVQYLLDKAGPDAVQRLIRSCGAGTPFAVAFAREIGPRPEWEARWLESIKVRYAWIPAVTGSSTLFALVALLCVLAYARRRRGQRLRLAEQDLEEQALAAAERITAAEQRAPLTEPRESPVVEAIEDSKPTLH